MTDEVMDRSKYLGGTDVAAALGFSPWKTPLQLAQEKRKPRVQTDEKKDRNVVLRRGKRWEAVALDMLGEALIERGHRFDATTQRNVRVTDAEHPFLSAEIDAIGVLDGEEVNIEIKTVHPFKVAEWGIVEGAEPMNDEIPVYYASQVQHGLGITGRARCVVGALVGADYMLPYIVPRDDEIIGHMRAALVKFWQECVLGGIDPDPVNIDDVRRLYKPTKDGIEATDEVYLSWLRYRALKRELKAREAELEVEEFAIAKYMGEHQVLVSSDGKELMTFKDREGTWFDESALKGDNPTLFKQYLRKWHKRTLSPRFPQSI